MRGKPFPFTDLSGGLNTRDAPYQLQPNEARDLLDVVPTARGAIRKRKGSTTFSSPASPLNSLHPLNLPADWLIGAHTTKLVKIDSAGAAADLKTGLTSGLRWEFVQAPASGGQGQLFGMNGTDTPQQWDGSAGSSSAWTASSGTLPNGKYVVYAGNRVWVAGVASDPSGLYWSDIGDPRVWPAENINRFDPNDGDVITGLAVYGPYVVVFKERKSFVVTDLDTGAERKLSETIGTVGHRSVVDTPRGLLFLAADGAIYSTNGSTVQMLSDKVSPTLRALVASQRRNVAAVLFANHYYLSFSTGGSANDRTLDLDLVDDSWWLHSLAANEWAIFEPGTSQKLYLARSDVAKVSEAFSDTYQDSGVNYSSRWAGPYHVFGSVRLQKRCRELHMDGSGKVDLYVSRDFANAAEFEQSIDFGSDTSLYGGADTYGGGGTFGGAPGVNEEHVYTLGVGRAWSVEFRQALNEAFEIDSYTMMMQNRRN